MSKEVQYVIVGIILLLCVAFIANKIIRTKKGKSSGCCGCPLEEECPKEDKDCNQSNF